MPRVFELMDRGSFSVALGDSVIVVARRMLLSRSGVVPVCENGRFCGVVTERDVVNFIGTAFDPLSGSAGDIMNAKVPVISPGIDIWQAANTMVEAGAWALPVVEKGNLLGMFTLQNFAVESPALAAMVFARTARREAVRSKSVSTVEIKGT